MFKNFNTKKFVLILLAVTLISFGVGGVLLNFTNSTLNPFNFSFNTNGLTQNISSSNISSSNINEEKFLTLDGINKVDASSFIGTINVIPEDRKDVHVTFIGSISIPDNLELPKLETSTNGSNLIINIVNKNLLFKTNNINPPKLILTIYVPNTYTGNLNLNSSMGDISVSNLTLKDFTCKLSMGKSTFNNLSLDTFNYTNSMGDLEATNISTNTSKVNCSMGKIKLNKFKGNLTTTNSMGDTDVTYEAFNNSVTMNASMGRIKLTLPSSSEFYLSATNSMGNIACDFSLTNSEKDKNKSLKGTSKNDSNKINLKNSMGEILVKSF